jgi:hypothetical protein
MAERLHSTLAGARQKWEMEPRVMSKAKRAKADAANWLIVCKQVDTRDKLKSRYSGKRANPKDMGLLVQGHRHHILRKSAGGPDTTENLVLLTGQEHMDVHAGLLVPRKMTAAGADGALEFTDMRTGKRKVSLPPGKVLKLSAIAAERAAPTSQDQKL